MITASAPAKAILVGEHTALYGCPALVMALDLRAYVTVSKRPDSRVVMSAPLGLEHAPLKRAERGSALVKRAVELVGGGFDIRIDSKIPIASGLGSSAAIASALVAALRAESGGLPLLRTSAFSLKERCREIEPELISIAKAAWECENCIHGASSGVDPFASTYGGLVLYQNGRAEKLAIEKTPQLVIAHSGITSDTKDVVDAVSRKRRKDPVFFDSFLNRSSFLAMSAAEAARRGDWVSLGNAMNENHKLLRGMGISSPKLDALVETACRNGAYGAKLSGAGRGGIMIALVDEKTKNRVSKALSKMLGKIMDIDFSEEGVRIE